MYLFFLFKKVVVHQHPVVSGENRYRQQLPAGVRSQQVGADAFQIQPQLGIGKILHVLKGRPVFFVSVHPRKGKENIRGILAFQHRSQEATPSR